ncbi:MAG: F0F1 ATP synthase subunit B family protein [Parasphingopyxis sp.]|uniref:F0F1 ATP synthase subunit B family protein n=1 Tax=Parasphingopyxis sp. TaxID=1920299 RepID=UPI003F9F4DFD
MPQLDQIVVSYASQIVWLVGVLAIIYFGIARTMVPKVQGTIEARAKRVSDDLAAADKAHERADEIEEDYRQQINEARSQAGAVTTEAKAKANADREQRVAAEDGKIEVKLAEAEAALAKARQAALAEIEGVAVDATQDIVAKVSGSSVSETEARSAVKEAMAHG